MVKELSQNYIPKNWYQLTYYNNLAISSSNKSIVAYMRLISLKLKSLILTLGLTGCASSGAAYSPIIDGEKTSAYQNDLKQCQDLAKERGFLNADLGKNALMGALGGSAFGAVMGGGRSAISSQSERKNIVKNCMTGRGYKVLG